MSLIPKYGGHRPPLQRVFFHSFQAGGLKRAGWHSVSILLEGIGREVDRHRGVPGVFNAVLEGYAKGD